MIDLDDLVEYGKIEFSDFSGKLEFWYEVPIDSHSSHVVSGEIPKKIITQGEEAISKYAQEKVKKAKEEWKKHEKIEEDIRKNPIPIKATYKDGTKLEGRIIEATSRTIRVKLDTPIEGEGEVRYNMFSAMSKKFVFDANHNISNDGYSSAYFALCNAYRNALNKPIKNLINRLNKK